MPYGATDMTQIFGIGSYVGELRQGPDGNIYEWVEGVDGLGNPIGFWKKAIKVVKGAAKKVARAGLRRLIPGPLRNLARRVCGTVDQMAPVMTFVPTAAPFYAGAKGLCRVFRGAGIAGMGYGVMEAPVPVRAAAAAAVPPAARAAARTVCGMINRLGPVLRFIPVAGSYYKQATGLCRTLRSAGIAGVEGPLMQASNGQLYEMIEGIGGMGEPVRYLRPLRPGCPPCPRRRRRGRRARMVRRVPPGGAPAAQAPTTQATAPVSGFGRLY
jgi:hypothetical protein